MRTPTVLFLAWASRLGTSVVAGRMNVYGPGVTALMARNAALFSCDELAELGEVGAHEREVVRGRRGAGWPADARPLPSWLSIRQPRA